LLAGLLQTPRQALNTWLLPVEAAVVLLDLEAVAVLAVI
jgi:hypothetical protein